MRSKGKKEARATLDKPRNIMTKAEMIEKMEALENRINELEDEVMNLEAEKQEIHNHYHSHYHYPKQVQPYVPYIPPYQPWWVQSPIYTYSDNQRGTINTSDTVAWNADNTKGTHFYTLTV